MRKTILAIVKKLLHTIVLLLVLSFVVFSFIRLIPGDPVRISMGPMTPEETIAQKRSELYFDRSLPVQWAHWLKGVITGGDFGESLFTHRNVAEDIKQYLPKSLELVFYCAIFILIMGVLVGTISAIFKTPGWITSSALSPTWGCAPPPTPSACCCCWCSAIPWASSPSAACPISPTTMYAPA